MCSIVLINMQCLLKGELNQFFAASIGVARHGNAPPPCPINRLGDVPACPHSLNPKRYEKGSKYGASPINWD